MILSKATCTLLKRLSLLTLIIFISSTLFAEELRVGIVTENTSYGKLLEDILTTFEDVVNNPTLFSLVEKRLSDEAELSYEKSINSYRESEKILSLETLEKKEIPVVKTLELKLVPLSLTDAERKYVLDNDGDAVEYVKLKNDIDLLIAAGESEGRVSEIKLYINGDEVRETLYTESLVENETTDLLGLFNSILTDGSYRLYKIDIPRVATLQIDGRNEPLYTSHVPLSDGEHIFIYGAPGHYREVKRIMTDGSFDTIELKLVSLETLPMLISTVPYNTTVFYNGQAEDNHLLTDTTYPFTITASSEGFSLYSLQSMQHRDKFTINLKPEWLSSDNIVTNAKAKFYASLLTTLLSFGAYVGVEVGRNIAPDRDTFEKLRPFRGLTLGVTVVSAITMADSLAKYYRIAKLGL